MASRPGIVSMELRNGIRLSLLVTMLAVAVTFLASPVLAQPAPDANSVLILSSVDGGGAYSAAATAAGLTVVTATDPQWSARTTPEFHTFKALIIGDPDCGGTPPAVAEANAAVWGAAVDGPTLIIGTDEFFHFGSGGGTLIASGVGFVTSGTAGQTGAYISLSCYYNSSPPTVVPLLAPFGVFTAEGNLGCYNDAHIVAIHPALAGSTDASLSNWSCSVHEVFRTFPDTVFIPVVIARNIGGVGSLTFGDGSFGVPYIVATGGGIIPIGPPAIVPTLSFPMLALLALALVGVALVLIRR